MGRWHKQQCYYYKYHYHHHHHHHQRIQFKLTVLVHKRLHGTAPSYLANELAYKADFEARSPYLLPHCRWLSIVHGCLPPVIGPSMLLLPILETAWPYMSHPHFLCLFSEVASRLSSSGVPSHDFFLNFCSACAVTIIILGHLNRSFYLLTYHHQHHNCYFFNRHIFHSYSM